MTNKCESCKFAVFEDGGYSNYTVEGRTFSCAKYVVKPFDAFYGVAPEFQQQAILDCQHHENGEPVKMDVEKEELPYLTEEQKEIYNSIS
jgi:hypothetical protein